MRAQLPVPTLVSLFTSLVAGCSILAPQPYRPMDNAQHRANAQSNLAMSILVRVDAVRKGAAEAVKVDGSKQTAQMSQNQSNCMQPKEACVRWMHENEAQSKVGAWSGFAIYATNSLVRYMGFNMVRPPGSPPWTLPPDVGPILAAEENVAMAEALVKQAIDEAHHVADTRQEQLAKVEQERPVIAEADAACKRDEGACKARCDKGELPFCYAWSDRLQATKPPRLLDAKAALQRACDGSLASACLVAPNVDLLLQQAAAQVEQLWRGAAEAGDELAQRTFVAENVAKMGRASELRTVLLFNEAVVSEKFCPARKAFVQAATLAEFQRRAAKHCHDEAPVAQGISGAQVTLTTLCTQAYATSCP